MNGQRQYSVCTLYLAHRHTLTDKHTMEYCSAMKKEGNFAICNNMDEPGWYYV